MPLSALTDIIGITNIIGSHGDDIRFGFWPSVDSGVLKIHDANQGMGFVMASGVLTVDNALGISNAALKLPDNVLLVEG